MRQPPETSATPCASTSTFEARSSPGVDGARAASRVRPTVRLMPGAQRDLDPRCPVGESDSHDPEADRIWRCRAGTCTSAVIRRTMSV